MCIYRYIFIAYSILNVVYLSVTRNDLCIMSDNLIFHILYITRCIIYIAYIRYIILYVLHRLYPLCILRVIYVVYIHIT